jgi:hypothetical protein
MRDYREPYLTVKDAAKHWGTCERSVRYALAEGMPHDIVFGRPKILASRAEPWLFDTGRATVGVTGTNGAASAATDPPPDTEE